MSNFHDRDHPYIQQVLGRAARDWRFRRRLKKDPKAAIKEETGIDVPPGFDIRFVERSGRRDLMALFPERPPDEEEVVNEAQEEEVVDEDEQEEVVDEDEQEEEDDDELDLEDLEEAAGGGDGGGSDPPETPW